MEKTKNRSSGTIFAAISKASFRPIGAKVPPVQLMSNFHDFSEPIYRKISLNSQENEILTNLHYTLFPKLISGGLQISDVEKFIEKAGGMNRRELGRIITSLLGSCC